MAFPRSHGGALLILLTSSSRMRLFFFDDFYFADAAVMAQLLLLRFAEDADRHLSGFGIHVHHSAQGYKLHGEPHGSTVAAES